MVWKIFGGDNQGANEVGDEKIKVVSTLARDPISHLENYLAYYVGRLEPGYAILVTGGWGSGKTHQIKKVLPETHAYYVSLFGLNTPEDIEGQVFAAMYPGKAVFKKLAEKTDGVNLEIPLIGALGTGGLGSALTSIFIKDDVDKSKPLILDDLERSTVDIKVLLGLINRYVEHHRCRVIVIAHDDKIVKDFVEAKEKVFGQTLVVEPNIEGAFDTFVNEFADKNESDGNRAYQREILAAFKESESASLRVLRHVVEDVGRLLRALEKRHWANSAAMVELIRLFSALAIEVRGGSLKRADLMKRGERVQYYRMSSASNNAGPPPAIVASAEKYKSVNIASTLLQDDVLVETLIEGRYVAEHIRQSLDVSAYYLKNEEAAPWQIVGNFDKLDDGIVDEALKRMNDQFANRQIRESGELLHIVALKMMMAYRGLTGETAADVKSAAIAYVDDLLARDLLPERPSGHDWTENFNTGYAQVQYWVHPDYEKDFADVFKHLIAGREKALWKLLPSRVGPLLDVVRTDGQKFLEKVCYTRNGKIEFEDVPILAHVSAKDFVDAWMASPKTGWYWIGNALKERRKAISHNASLLPEDAWYPKVVAELMKRAKATSGLAQLRIIRAAELTGVPLSPPRKRRATVPMPSASAPSRTKATPKKVV